MSGYPFLRLDFKWIGHDALNKILLLIEPNSNEPYLTNLDLGSFLYSTAMFVDHTMSMRTMCSKIVIYFISEKFIVLKCIFKLQRSFKSIISRIYVPSSFLVVLTWATFYIPSTSIPARITLIVTNFLATVFITQSTSSNIADVEYTTAVGLYLLANVVFITLTLLILLLVLNLPDKDIKVLPMVILSLFFLNLLPRSIKV